MPRLKSAIKRVKIYERNRLRNLSYKTQIKTVMKKLFNLVSQKDEKSANAYACKAFAIIDKSVIKGIIHKHNGAHKKSRISKWLKSLEPTASQSKS